MIRLTKEALEEVSLIKKIVYSLRDAINRQEVLDRANITEYILFGHASIDVEAKTVEMIAISSITR